MFNENTTAKMNVLVNDPTFMAELKKVSSGEELMELLAKNGIEMTKEEYDVALEKGTALVQKKNLFSEDGELTTEMLELVNGGGWGKALACWAIAGACIYFGCPQAGIVMIGVGLACL